ncbi:MAG: hypothetical protein AB7O59_11735 [Pirellulales bacterium]
MRTNIDAIVTNSTVFGFGQDRAVATRIDETCAYAAQHLSSWHAGKRVRHGSRAMKRSGQVVRAGAVGNAWPLRLAVTGPQRQPVRLMSPVLVMA